MRITSLEIERFGVWENLYLPKIRRGINVFYGPNEAGKTTLMQFIRSGLYGCCNPERARYIQMALYPKAESPFAQKRLSPTEFEETESVKKKGSPEETKWIGGVLTVQDEYGTHRLERRYVRRSASSLYGASSIEAKAGFVVSGGLAAWSGRFFPIPGTGIAESLIISGDDGQRLSDHFVQTIVNNVDESTFNNVFAIGLDELQKLGTLNETDAAQMLYRLSVGMDRVSLIQVLHQLVEERNEIYDIKGRPGILDSLITRRNELSQKSLSSSTNLREYADLRGQQQEAEETVRQLDDKLAVHSRQKRIYEIAARIAPLWDERANLHIELGEYGKVIEVKPEAVLEAESKLAEIADVRKSLAGLGDQYKQTRKVLQNTLYNRGIWQNAPLIDLLVSEIPHLEEIDRKAGKVQSEIAAVQKELDLEEQRLRGARGGKILLTSSVLQTLTDPDTGLPAGEVDLNDAEKRISAVPEVREIEDFRGPARAVFSALKRYRKARDLNSEAGERFKSLSAELEHELTAHGQKNLDEAIAVNSELATQMRRRIEIGKRLTDLDRIKRELTRQNGYLVANQSLPYPVTIAIGIGVALGGLLAVFAFLGKGPFDPSIGVLGILLAIGVLFYKTTIERKNYAKLEENQRQLAAVMKRLDQVKAEAAVIDQKYPAPGQTPESRLQKAEASLAAFQRLIPLDSRLKETAHRQKLLEKRYKMSKSALSSAHSRWVSWLKTAGLSPTLKPSHIKGMLQRADLAEALRRQIETKRNVLDLHARERKGITDRLDLLMAETGTPALLNGTATEQIEYLRELLDQVRETRKNRGEQVRKLAGFRKERNKVLAKIHRMNVELDDYLSLFDAKSVDQLKEFANRYNSHQTLLDKLQTVESKIESGIGGFCEEDEIGEVLNSEKTRADLPALTDALDERITKLSADKQEKTLQIGRLAEQLANLAAQRDFVDSRFETAAVSRRIDEMARIWQSRAVACKMMEDIRKAYEKERQPETLKEASRLLSRLTDGLYVKIWTPLGEDTLYVDTSDGETLDIGSLSRGTREQLFIAIRLALAVSFEKHGVNLPLILDDVLVNFDNHRAAAAADVLREFAEAGRQIFLFTCHQHICRTFLKLDRPVFVLPDKTTKVKQFRVILPPSMERLPEEAPEEPKAISVDPTLPRIISPVSVKVSHQRLTPLEEVAAVDDEYEYPEDGQMIEEAESAAEPRDEEADGSWDDGSDRFDIDHSFTDDDEFEEGDDEEEKDETESEDDAGENETPIPPQTETVRDYPPMSAGSDWVPETNEGTTISSEKPEIADGKAVSVEIGEGEAFDDELSETDNLENAAVSADVIADTPDDSAEDEPKKTNSFEFSNWNDFVRSGEKKDAEPVQTPEDEAEEEEETESEFLRNYFTRESKTEFFDDGEEDVD